MGMAPALTSTEETLHLESEESDLLTAHTHSVDLRSSCSSQRSFSSYRTPIAAVSLLVGALVGLLLLLGHTDVVCSDFIGWNARLLCHRRHSLHETSSDSLRFYEEDGKDAADDEEVEEYHSEEDRADDSEKTGEAAGDDASDAKLCNPSSPVTEKGWKSRAWEVNEGLKMACEARNRLKDNWKVRFSTEDRNWCWVGVKDVCHRSIHRPQNWAAYRAEASREELSPSAREAPFDGLQNPKLCDDPDNGLPSPYTKKEEAKALTWFHENVRVYVVNLQQYVERWKMVSGRLQELGIKATRVEGVNMQEGGMLKTAKKQGWIPQTFNFSEAQRVAYGPRLKEGSVLGTVGCASAHFKVQEQLIKDGSPLGLVLEDDSYLIDGFVVHLWRIVTTELPCDWDILQLLARCPYGKCVSKHLARIQPDGNEPDWRCHAGVNWGMHAMLYRTSKLPAVQKLWKATVFNESSPHCLDVDVALASISDRVGYYAIPNSQTPGLLKEMPLGSARGSINTQSQR
eukprot:TRINITY_DN3762_c0_g2_i1.p1 TRINITY_DN3762_c0_g2~~TRINITY_DN3762_c0_g2_i1.p1  ORF type:complete len:514 (-),score=85.92 TRINITY_DN3762_c0_g2_i1:174-1715(-)